MTSKNGQGWSGLPQHLRGDPALIHMRLDNHEERLNELEARPEGTEMETPFGKFHIPPAALVAIGLLAWARPDIFHALLGK